MKIWIYTKRNLKELLSDRLSLIFMIGLPAFLLVFMVLLEKSIGVNDSFKVENFVPASIIFSFGFLTLFSGMLISKDRTSSFLSRLFISPLKPYHYILGYILPLIIIALVQSILLYIIGFLVGLPFTINILGSIPFLMFISVLFIGFGLLFGSLFKDQQVGPISSILIQVVAFLSGMWFSLDLIGGAFETIGKILPFSPAVNMIRYILLGQYNQITIPLLIVLGYVFVIIVLAVLAFRKNMKEQPLTWTFLCHKINDT